MCIRDSCRSVQRFHRQGGPIFVRFYPDIFLFPRFQVEIIVRESHALKLPVNPDQSGEYIRLYADAAFCCPDRELRIGQQGFLISSEKPPCLLSACFRLRRHIKQPVAVRDDDIGIIPAAGLQRSASFCTARLYLYLYFLLMVQIAQIIAYPKLCLLYTSRCV